MRQPSLQRRASIPQGRRVVGALAKDPSRSSFLSKILNLYNLWDTTLISFITATGHIIGADSSRNLRRGPWDVKTK